MQIEKLPFSPRIAQEVSCLFEKFVERFKNQKKTSRVTSFPYSLKVPGHRDAMVTATTYAHVTSDQAENASIVFAKAVE